MRKRNGWAENNHVDIVFAQYTPEDEEVDGAEGAIVANHLYEQDICKNIILCSDTPFHSIDAWDSDASFFYLKPVSNGKIRMGLSKLRYPLNPIKIMQGRLGVMEKHLTEEDEA